MLAEKTLELPRLALKTEKEPHSDPLAWSARVAGSKPLLTEAERDKASRTMPVTYREHTIGLQYRDADSPYQHRPTSKRPEGKASAAAIARHATAVTPQEKGHLSVDSKTTTVTGNTLQIPKQSRAASVVVIDGSGFFESPSRQQKFLPPLPPASPREHAPPMRKKMSIYTLDTQFDTEPNEEQEEAAFLHEIALVVDEAAPAEAHREAEESDSRPQSPSTYLFEWNMVYKFADGPPSDNTLQELAKVLSQVITPVKVALRNPKFQELQVQRQKEIWKKHWYSYQNNMHNKQGKFLENHEKRSRAKQLNWKQQKQRARCMHWRVFAELQRFAYCIHDPLVRHRQNQTIQERRERALIVLTNKFLPLWRRYRTRNERKSKRVLHRFFVRIFRESRYEAKRKAVLLIFDFLKLLRTRNGVLLGVHMFVAKVRKLQRAWRQYWKKQKASVQLWMLQCEKYSSEFFTRMDIKAFNIPQVVLFQIIMPFRLLHRRAFIRSLLIYQNAVRAEAAEVAAFMGTPQDAYQVRSKLEKVGRRPMYRYLLLKVDCHELLLQCLKGSTSSKRITETHKKKKKGKAGKKK